MIKCKRRFMHGKRRRKSPIKQDLDLSLTDTVYTKQRVDSELRKSGHYAGPKDSLARGKKRESESYTGKDVGGGMVFLGGSD